MWRPVAPAQEREPEAHSRTSPNPTTWTKQKHLFKMFEALSKRLWKVFGKSMFRNNMCICRSLPLLGCACIAFVLPTPPPWMGLALELTASEPRMGHWDSLPELNAFKGELCKKRKGQQNSQSTRLGLLRSIKPIVKVAPGPPSGSAVRRSWVLPGR